MKAWVKTEKDIAKILNGKRIERKSYGDSEPDVITERFVVECKSRKNGFPKLIEKAFEQVQAYAKRYNKIPIVVLHRNGKRGYGRYFVVMEINDFKEVIDV